MRWVEMQRNTWKSRITLILQENELWDIVYSTQANPVVVPTATDVTTKAGYDKKNIKDERIILHAVKDHVIPHMTGKDNAYQMWDSLTRLYHSSNENRKIALREKLKSMKTIEAENVISYLTRIT